MRFSLLCLVLFNNLIFSQVGIGTTNPNNTLEINSATAGQSGLTFTQLTSTSNKFAPTGNVLSINSAGDVILSETFPKVVSAISNGINALTPDNTTILIGEIMVRSDKIIIGNSGNLQIRSSTASNVTVTMTSFDVFSPIYVPTYVFASTILDTNTGSWTGFFAGNTENNEQSIYHITTSNGGYYRITIANRANLTISVIGEQLR